MKSKWFLVGVSAAAAMFPATSIGQSKSPKKSKPATNSSKPVSTTDTKGAAAGKKDMLPVMSSQELAQRLSSYKRVTLTTDTSLLSAAERKCLTHMIKAAEYADAIFWKQAIGPKEEFLSSIKDTNQRKFAAINYGPWDRLNNDKPFISGYGVKPAGAQFYVEGFTTKLVKDTLLLRDVLSPYTLIKKYEMPKPPPPMKPGADAMPMDPMDMELPNPGMPMEGTDGQQYAIQKYSEAYRKEIMKIVMHLNEAAQAIEGEDKEFAEYLRMRSGGLMMDDYIMSDIQWLGLKSHLDIVIGPIENYEDKLTGQKTSYESYVLVRDMEWGKRLEKYVAMLPSLQAGLPVEPKYKPVLNSGSDASAAGEIIQKDGFPPMQKPAQAMSSLAVFDVVYYGGDCNSGSKTIAVNLPNDETIQENFGTRRSQLKNTMKAKFDHIVVPISKLVIAPEQQKHITFDAFFNNVMFHEVAHGLGVKYVVSGSDKSNASDKSSKTIREALGVHYSALEECKADVLGLYMVTELFDKKELGGKLDDYYVTFVASVFRSVRFGASSAHGKANMITFNTLLERGAIVYSASSTGGYYTVNVAKMRSAIAVLAGSLLQVQGDGDPVKAADMLQSMGNIREGLAADLNRIEAAAIPVDLVFDQGISTLGLDKYFDDPEVKMREWAKQQKQRGGMNGGMNGNGMGMPGGPGTGPNGLGNPPTGAPPMGKPGQPPVPPAPPAGNNPPAKVKK